MTKETTRGQKTDKGYVRPLLEKLLPAHFAENPGAQNKVRIQEGFSRALGQTGDIEPNAFFKVQEPVELIKRGGKTFQATLRYTFDEYYPHEDEVLPFHLTVGLETRTGFIAERDWFTDVRLSGTKPKHVVIVSRSNTFPFWEGHGFGSSLIFLSHDVIRHAIKHFTVWAGLSVKAQIEDQARGHFRNRNEWTSFYAKKLGYQEMETGIFIKWYHQVARDHSHLHSSD